MSKSTNTVVYFDWKTLIYIYVCGKCRTQFMLPNSSRRWFINMYIYDRKVSHMHRRMCLWDYTQTINRSFVYKAKEGSHVRIYHKTQWKHRNCHLDWTHIVHEWSWDSPIKKFMFFLCLSEIKDGHLAEKND